MLLMNDDTNEVTIWLQRLNEQPDEAMHRLWQTYYTKLVTYARNKLRAMPRRSSDEEDVAVSAINSFFQAAQQQRFPQLNDREDLWRILLTITSRKAMHAIRDSQAQKRGAGTVRGESVFVNASDNGGHGIDVSAEPTEAFGNLFATELLEQLDRLGDDRLREIAAKKLEGYSNADIAEQLGVAVRTIERKLGRIRACWEEQNSLEP